MAAAGASRTSYLTAGSASLYSVHTDESAAAAAAGAGGSRSRSASPSPSNTPSIPSRSSTAGGQSLGGSGIHRTPPSPQDTFGPHTPMTPGHAGSGKMPTMLAVPDPATMEDVDLNSSPERYDPPRASYARKRADTPESTRSEDSGNSYPHSPTTRSGRSGRSSWQLAESPIDSTIALAIARKQRISQNPPLPDKPYQPPPESQSRPLTPNAATSLLAAAAATASAGHPTSRPHTPRAVSSSSLTPGGGNYASPLASATFASNSASATSFVSAQGASAFASQQASVSSFAHQASSQPTSQPGSAKSLTPPQPGRSPVTPSPGSARSLTTPPASATVTATGIPGPPRSTRAGKARERVALAADKNKPLPEIVPQPAEAPKRSTDLASAIAAGEVPRFPFLNEDPTRAESPTPRGGVSVYSGPLRRSQTPVGETHRSPSPHGSINSTQRKHLSGQSAGSEPFGYGHFQSSGYGTSSSMADAGASERPSLFDSGDSMNSSRPGGTPMYSAFAGGPPIAWGQSDRSERRDSLRSFKSVVSNRSSRSRKRRSNRSGKGSGNGNSGSGSGNGNGNGNGDEDVDVDLFALARRAAVLERLLRHGKRVSALTTNQRNYNRYSAWSSTTSNPPSRRASARYAHQRAVTPPRTSPSADSSSSIRKRLQRRFASGATSDRDHGPSHDFTGLESGDDEEVQSTESSAHDASSARSPIRRVLSSSLSRLTGQPEPSPSPGAGAGIIVFPELATMPPVEPPLRDGEVCAQACLPPSLAVPYTPLPPPPPASIRKKTYSGGTGRTERSGGTGGSGGTGSGSSGQGYAHGQGHGHGHGHALKEGRSYHSLRNVQNIEKAEGEGHHHDREMGMGSVPGCDERVLRPLVRRKRLVAAVVCVLVIALIVGLLAGLLTRRAKEDS